MDIERVHQRLLYMATSIRDVLTKKDIPYILAYGNLLGAVRHQGFIPWDDDFDLFLFDDTYDEAIELLRENLPSDLFLEDAKSEPLFYHGWARVKDLRTKIQKKISLTTNVYQHQGLDVDLFRLKKMKEDEEQLYRATEHQKYLIRLKQHNLISEEDFIRRIQEVENKIDIEKANLQNNRREGNRDIYTFCVFYDDRIYPEDLFPLKEYRFENTSFLGPNNSSPYLTCCYGDYMKLPDPDKRRSHYSDVLFLDDDKQ